MITRYFLISLIGAILGGCAGCDKNPVTPTPGGVGGMVGIGGVGVAGVAGSGDPMGGAGPGVDGCDLACERAATLGCPQAEPEDGVTCSELCRQVPVLRNSTKCAATASTCEAFDNCSATPD